jgi:hypothetical protein
MPLPPEPNPLEHFENWVQVNNWQTESHRWLAAFYAKTFPGRVVPLLAFLLGKGTVEAPSVDGDKKIDHSKDPFPDLQRQRRDPSKQRGAKPGSR